MNNQISQFYQEKGFSGSSGFGKHPAIVVVDLIKGFTDPQCPLGANNDKLFEYLIPLLDTARENDTPIFFTTVIYETPDEGGYFVKKVPALQTLTLHSEWVELDHRLKRKDTEPVVVKKYASAFFGTPLASYLTSKSVDTVIVTGVTTSGCIRATVVDALQHGFRVITPLECVGDRAKDPHEANLFDIQAKYGDVLPTQSVIRHLISMKSPG